MLKKVGWLPIRGEPVAKYAPRDDDDEVWPPKYWKFLVETEEQPKVEAAFTDPRRFARIRLVDCAAEDIRKTTPLKENGPDPVIDRDILTLEWFEQKMNRSVVRTLYLQHSIELSCAKTNPNGVANTYL